MPKSTVKRKKRPTDATLRNVRAAHTRELRLAKRLSALEAKVALLNLMVQQFVTQQQMAPRVPEETTWSPTGVTWPKTPGARD